MKRIWYIALLPFLMLIACQQTPKAPALELTVVSPQDGATLGSTSATVTGSVTPADATVSYTVNGGDAQDVTVAPSGVFSFEVALEPGENTIVVTATLGEQTDSETLNVTATPTVASGVNYSAELSEGDPTFTRPDDGSGLSDAERTNPYHAFTFRVEADGWYALTSAQQFDGYLLLYKGGFDPENPVTEDDPATDEDESNPIAENDDAGRSYDPDADPPGISEIVAELEAGVDYVLVTTACGDPDAGCGPNVGAFTNTIAPTSEPAPPPPPFQLPEPDPDRFNITVRFLTTNVTADQQAVFVNAANRWSEIITDDLGDIPLGDEGVFLDPNAAPVAGTIDDVLIDVRFIEIDGPSGVLGRAGPRFVRQAGTPNENLTIYGIMEFDVAEFGNGGFFDDPQAYQDTITHEMGHVIGIGTLWDLTGNTEGTQSNPPTVPPGLPNPDYDPRFTGAMATAEYQALLADAGRDAEDSVPIANTGGPGNYNGHWREITFDNELMTPYAGGEELLSKMTAASLGDIGYAVDLNSSAIDAGYVLPPPYVPGEFRQTAPTPTEYQEGKDFVVASDSPRPSDAAGAVVNVDLKLDDLPGSTSGCEASDFDGLDLSGKIALVRRGACPFANKVLNAVDAGAVGVIIMNTGDDPSRMGLLDPSLGDAADTVPVVFITYDLGVTLANTSGLEVEIQRAAPATVTLETLRVGGGAPAFDEELLFPIGSISPQGGIKLFPGN